MIKVKFLKDYGTSCKYGQIKEIKKYLFDYLFVLGVVEEVKKGRKKKVDADKD